MYDFFTYCDFRFRSRRRKWIGMQELDRSIVPAYRSLDNMCFSSQYYFISTITTWGILFAYLGLTIMIRNMYNPFADPLLVINLLIIIGSTIPIKYLIKSVARFLRLWELSRKHFSQNEVGGLTFLAKHRKDNTIEHEIHTLVYRHKFILHNKQWIIE